MTGDRGYHLGVIVTGTAGTEIIAMRKVGGKMGTTDLVIEALEAMTIVTTSSPRARAETGLMTRTTDEGLEPVDMTGIGRMASVAIGMTLTVERAITTRETKVDARGHEARMPIDTEEKMLATVRRVGTGKEGTGMIDRLLYQCQFCISCSLLYRVYHV